MSHLHHRHVHGQHAEVEKRQDVHVVYVTLSKSFDGPAVMVTGQPHPGPTSVPAAEASTHTGPIVVGPPVSTTRNPLRNPKPTTETQVPVPVSTHHTELDPQPTSPAASHPVSSPTSSPSPTTNSPKPSPKTGSQEKPSRTTTQHVKTTQKTTRTHITTAKSTSKSVAKNAKTTAKPTPAHSHNLVNAGEAPKQATTPPPAGISSQSDSITGPSTGSTGSGMSGGAVTGLAIGLLLGMGAIIAIVFLIYRRKKKTEGMQKLDDETTPFNEKSPIPPPAPVAAANIRSQNNAPHLSLRPSSQFSPLLTGSGKPEMTQNGRLAPNAAPASAWERRGAQNDPSNPFGAHAEKSTSPEPRELKADSFAIAGGKVPESGRVSPPEQQQPPQSPTAPSIRSVSSRASVQSGFTDASEAPSVMAGGAPGAPGAPGGPGGPGGAPSNVHRVQMDFQPTMDDELEVRAGQLVRILHSYDDGWALCIRMDRSQQGVVPRSCLSKHPLKPRQPGGPRGGPRGAAGPRGPPPFAAQPPRPLSPGGRNSPGPNGRPMSPAGGRNSPAPPFTGPGPRPASPLGPRGPPHGPGARPRAGTAGGPGPRSMSPGPYGPGGQRPDQPAMRRRSNSAGDIAQRRQSPPSGPSPLNPQAGMPTRKPVPGQAM